MEALRAARRLIEWSGWRISFPRRGALGPGRRRVAPRTTGTRWDAVAAVRERADPDRVFANDYLVRVLGP